MGKTGTQTATYIAGITDVSIVGTPVTVSSTGQLGIRPSSARFKEQINAMEKASEVLCALKPVTFHYKKELDPESAPQFGLVAEEVAEVNPDLVTCDEKGKPYTVRYEAVNTMLLNEFLKKHRQGQEQERKLEKLEGRIADLQSAPVNEPRNSKPSPTINSCTANCTETVVQPLLMIMLHPYPQAAIIVHG